MMFTRDELINATGAVVLRDSLGNNASMFNISTDTRTIKAEDIYLPLKGESFDGEKFIDKAIEAGAKHLHARGHTGWASARLHGTNDL